MSCSPTLRLAPALLLLFACSDPAPVAPTFPVAASVATDCTLGMSDADAYTTLDAIVAEVNALETAASLNSGQANALRKHVENVRTSIGNGNYCAAASQLKAFKEQVSNFVTDGVLTPPEADPLTGGATDVLVGAYYVSFSSDRSGDWEIYTARADGSSLVNMTNNPAQDAGGHWSPDGSQMAFHSDREGRIFKLFIMNADGSGQRRLTNPTSGDGKLRWSPDGSRIAFVRFAPMAEVWVMHADGSNQTRVIDGDTPEWSPDGTRLVYSAYRNLNVDIYAIDLDGTDEIRLTTERGADQGPQWSPDGSQIVWSTYRDGNVEIYSIKPDGTGLTRLTNNTLSNSLTSWTPDGTVLVLNGCVTFFSCQIFTIRSDGTGETNISDDPTSYEFNADLSPDGTRLVYARAYSLNPNRRDVGVMNADGTGKRILTNSTSDNIEGAWRPK